MSLYNFVYMYYQEIHDNVQSILNFYDLRNILLETQKIVSIHSKIYFKNIIHIVIC